jgi:hypothetical protein
VTSPLEAVTAHWRDEAHVLRRRGAEVQAGVLEQCAEELETALRERALEALTLEEAAGESGYTTDHLGRLVRDGTVPNAGRPNAPRILRRYLPLKPGSLPTSETSLHVPASSRQVVRAIAQGGTR